MYNCSCTEEDWECDADSIRNNEGSCVSLKHQETLIYTAPEICEDYYYISTGYRKIAGDSCIGGVNHSQLQIPCPNNRKHIY